MICQISVQCIWHIWKSANRSSCPFLWNLRMNQTVILNYRAQKVCITCIIILIIYMCMLSLTHGQDIMLLAWGFPCTYVLLKETVTRQICGLVQTFPVHINDRISSCMLRFKSVIFSETASIRKKIANFFILCDVAYSFIEIDILL